MSSYLSQLLPHSADETPTNEGDDLGPNREESLKPEIEFLAIFNPKLVGDGELSDEELYKQILCFVEYGGSEEYSTKRKVKTIGLIRGMETLTENFIPKESGSFVIRGAKVSTLVKELEENYYITLSCQHNKSDVCESLLNDQMMSLVEQGYRFFKIFNSSFNNVMEVYGRDVLATSLEEFWGEFVKCYNQLNLIFPKPLAWPNLMNYRGFLGSLSKNNRSFKKSTIKLNSSIENDLHYLLKKDSPEKSLKGILVSCLKREEPKENGVIYMKSASLDSHTQTFSTDNLTDIFNLIEHQFFLQNLTTDKLNDANGTFSVGEGIKKNISTDYALILKEKFGNSDINKLDVPFILSNLEILNPVTLTNNLVVNPLNYTFNSVVNIASNVPITANDTSNLLSNATSFFRRSPNPNPDPSSNNGNESMIEARSHENENEASVDENDETVSWTEEELKGVFLYGVEKELSSSSTIPRNLIYLENTYIDSEGEVQHKETEYSLLLYKKGDIYVTLIYDSSNMELDNHEFYSNLSNEFLEPLSDEIYLGMSNRAQLSNSINSLRSFDRYLPDRNANVPGKASEFFYISFDKYHKWIKSSLPYLPLIDLDENNLLNRMKIKSLHSLIYLHDELTNLFNQENIDIFEDDSLLNEYFHKFNSTRSNNWMFYYIKHESEFTIIIKNHIPNQGGLNRNQGGNAESDIKSQYNQNFLSKLATGVYDYTNLGFLDSLGDDVKLWLENFHVNENP